MRARIGAVPDARLADHLADRSTWTIPDQLTADLLIATSLPATAQPSSSQRPDDDASLGVVRRGAETGWVLRLLGHGARTAAHLRSA